MHTGLYCVNVRMRGRCVRKGLGRDTETVSLCFQAKRPTLHVCVEGAVTLGISVSCSLARNFVVTQVAPKITKCNGVKAYNFILLFAVKSFIDS